MKKLIAASVATGIVAGLWWVGANLKKPKTNLQKVMEWAEKGDVDFQYALAEMHETGRFGTSKSDAEAARWYLLAANQGHPLSQFTIASMYYEGRGVMQDYHQAAEWYRKSSTNTFCAGPAMVTLGNMYQFGLGVPQDMVEAVSWFKRASDKGNNDGQFRLAIAMLNGSGISKNTDEGTRLMKISAGAGNAPAARTLGHLYHHGESVELNLRESTAWYLKAAEMGDPESQFEAGYAYFTARGIPKNEAVAAKWFREAAEQGHVDAQGFLGSLCLSGLGVMKDEIEGYKWSLLAGARGSMAAKENTAAAERVLGSAQRAEGQRLAREWTPRRVARGNTSKSEPRGQDLEPTATGTGFAVTSDGYFVTNAHVVDGARRLRLRTSGATLDAAVVRVDVANDFALLKVDGHFSPLPVVSSQEVELGATVATVGFPNIHLQGHSPKLAKGEIAGRSGLRDDARHFQVSLPVQPGNSGGAVVDTRGNVVGVVVGKLSQNAAIATTGELVENVNYAIKSSLLLLFLETDQQLAGKLVRSSAKTKRFEDLVSDIEKASALVLVY